VGRTGVACKGWRLAALVCGRRRTILRFPLAALLSIRSCEPWLRMLDLDSMLQKVTRCSRKRLIRYYNRLEIWCMSLRRIFLKASAMDLNDHDFYPPPDYLGDLV